MKKIMPLLVIAFLLFGLSPAFAKIRTVNVDAEDYGDGESMFKYKVAYQFATTDVTQGCPSLDLPTDATITNHYYYAMPFKGSIIGVAISSNAALTVGSATAEVTINNQVTGVRVALDAGAVSRHMQSGLIAAHTQYNVQTLNYDDTSPSDWGGLYHNDIHKYGKATAVEVGDYIGVELTTSSILAPMTNEVIVTVIILQ